MLDKELCTQVAWACRILAGDGHADLTLGHVSVRSSDNIVYIKRKDIGLDEVTPGDVLAIDLDCNILAGEGVLHLETVLHSEVYKVRRDVNSIAHTHAPYATALGATTADLALINHDAVLFYDGLGHFEETAGLISSSDMGKMVAQALGAHRAVIMGNHGVLCVGSSVPWLTYTALTLERAIKIQAIATSLGPLKPVSKEAAKRLFAEKYRDEFIHSYWEYLIRRARSAGQGAGMPGDDRQDQED